MIAQKLRIFAEKSSEKAAFILEGLNTNKSTITYGTLERKVNILASFLCEQKLHKKGVLLIYQNVMDFIIAFLACQQAGIIAIPATYSKNERQFRRLKILLENAGANTILCTGDIKDKLSSNGLNNSSYKLNVISTDHVDFNGNLIRVSNEIQEGIAFIQYTSGSTDKPKGVIITHKNLEDNQKLLQYAFGCDNNSLIVSWLPFNHDMGLIGSILHTIYVGCTCVLTSPTDFIQSPLWWLDLITKYKATHSGGPDFAYRYCAEKLENIDISHLDLSSWKVAYNGSEPVKYETITAFNRVFNPVGFSKEAFTPCYGLAEATLLVTGIKRNSSPDILFVAYDVDNLDSVSLSEQKTPASICLVSCGEPPPGLLVKIMLKNNWSNRDLQKGEICISGEGVTQGYLNTDNSSLFYDWKDQRMLRTGDEGFIYNKQLYVCGRIKEIIIIRGKNYYPHDIEDVVVQSHPAFVRNGAALCSLGQYDERLILIIEIKRQFINVDLTDLFKVLIREISFVYEIELYDILIVSPNSIPKTTSGKVQRLLCAELYKKKKIKCYGSLQAFKKHTLSANSETSVSSDFASYSQEHIKKFLLDLISKKSPGINISEGHDNVRLTELGIDSIRAMEIINSINKHFYISINASNVLQNETVAGLADLIENMLWLKNEGTSEKEISI